MLAISPTQPIPSSYREHFREQIQRWRKSDIPGLSDSFLKPLDIYTYDKAVGWLNGANGGENTEQGSHNEQKVVGGRYNKTSFLLR